MSVDTIEARIRDIKRPLSINECRQSEKLLKELKREVSEYNKAGILGSERNVALEETIWQKENMLLNAADKLAH